MAELIILGQVQVTGSKDVLFNGLEFMANGTTNTTGPSNPALVFHGSGNYDGRKLGILQRDRGGASDARAISLDTSVSGSVTIDHNAFTGASTGNFSTASWGRGVWSDGTSSDLNITNNTFTNVRSGLNLDGYDDTKVDVSHNVFASAGSGISVGTPTGSGFTGIHDNDFQSVGDDFNLQNVTTPINFDLTATDNQTSGVSQRLPCSAAAPATSSRVRPATTSSSAMAAMTSSPAAAATTRSGRGGDGHGRLLASMAAAVR